jgi:hypothetical protein
MLSDTDCGMKRVTKDWANGNAEKRRCGRAKIACVIRRGRKDLWTFYLRVELDVDASIRTDRDWRCGRGRYF